MLALNIKNLSHKINKQNILKEISLSLEIDKIACVLGPSGCGKTTLLKLIAGLEKTQQGEIFMRDQLVSSSNIHLDTGKRNIGFLFQDYALFPHLTVEENLKFAIKKNNQNQEINEITKLIKLNNAQYKYPHELSGGEQQRVALARSIIAQPNLLLLDEPFSSLDLSLKEEIRDDTLHLLQKFNISVIVVTHDPFEAMFISNQIYIMQNDGTIAQSGTPQVLYNSPSNAYVAGIFGETNKFRGIVKNSKIYTPIGKFPVPANLNTHEVEIIIRPQAIKLSEEETPVNGIKGTVMASKLMGSFSFIHLSVLDHNNEVLHVHSHMPPTFLPKQAAAVGIEVDEKQIFIFPSK